MVAMWENIKDNLIHPLGTMKISMKFCVNACNEYKIFHRISLLTNPLTNPEEKTEDTQGH